MSGSFDGSIRINTKVDESGFNKGTRNMTSSMKGVLSSIKAVGRALVAVFVGGTIINAIRSLIGNFDFMNSSIGGALKPLSEAFTTLKGTFINLIATALIPLVPYIVIVVNWLTNLLNIVIQVVAALFGMDKTVGSITKNVVKSSKDAKNALAAFDQLNVLQKNKDNGAGEEPFITPPPMSVTQDIKDKVEKIKKWFLDMWTEIKLATSEAWAWFMTIWGPASTWINEHIIKPLSAWIDENPEKFKKFALILGLVVLAFILLALVIFNWTAILGIAAVVMDAFALGMVVLTSPITLVILVILLLIGTVIALILWWPVLVEAATRAWVIIQAVWTAASAWFKLNVIDRLQSGFFTMLDSVKDKFRIVFQTIKDIVTSIINGIILSVQSMVAAVVGGINTILSGMNSIGQGAGVSSVPLIASPKMPRLANGAVIPPNAEFAAILGDQRSGKNIEAPENLIRQIIREEMQGSQSDISVPIILTLDGEVIYKNQQRVSRRYGKSLVTGGVK